MKPAKTPKHSNRHQKAPGLPGGRSGVAGRRPGVLAGLVVGVAAITCAIAIPAAPGAPAAAATTARVRAGSTAGPVSTTPARGTPQLATTGTTEQIRQIVQCGGIMYAVGSFTEIQSNGTTYPRNNIFSFRATAPYQVTSWNPDVNGLVNSIALTARCHDAYIGGSFTAAGGTTVRNIAEIDVSTGTVVKKWAHNANKDVGSVLLTPGGHLLVGGEFTKINGGSANPYYVSLNPVTGLDDGYLHLSVSGTYVYGGVAPNHTEIYNQQLSPDGTRVLAEGVFTSVGGQPRQQIFMMSLGSGSGTVTGWTSSLFNQNCADSHPLYVKTAAWSPDGNTVYIATTGFHLHDWKGTFPLTGPCDVAAAFPATQGSVTPVWTNYDGCYTLLSVAADASTVYIGGHEQYGDNPNGCKTAGPGSFPAPGLGGINAATGALLLNPAGTAGLYSRSRGLGADDMLLTSAGLWIASDNMGGAAMCDGVFGHAGLCFLPYG